MNQANLKLFISSASRTTASESSSNFAIKFPTNNYLQNRRNMRLAYLGMYNTFYNVDASNNNLNFRVGATTYSITAITPGSYDANTLAGLVQTAMTSQIANSWNVSYNSNTKKYTISGTSAFELLFASGAQAATSLWKVLGFASSNGLTGIDTSSATSTTSTQIGQLTHPLVCYVKLSINSDQTFSSDAGDCFTFAIPVNVQPGELIEYKANDTFDQYTKLSDNMNFINSIAINLAGQNFTDLSLNGSEWICILEFYQ